MESLSELASFDPGRALCVACGASYVGYRRKWLQVKENVHKFVSTVLSLVIVEQRRMGVEPTRGRAERPPSRFEDGEAHRDPYTSIALS